MANAHQIHPKDYQKIADAVITPIYERNICREVYPIINDLDISTLQVRYYTQEDDHTPDYGMEPGADVSHIAYNYTDKDTPVITENLHYGVDELARVNNSSIPLDGRIATVGKLMQGVENRIAFSEATIALDDVIVTGVSNAANATVWGATPFNTTTHALCIASVEAALGQLIDGIGELVDPLALLLSPDIYKLVRGLDNANTDLNTIKEINERFNSINSASPGVIMSPDLVATWTKWGTAAGKYTRTLSTDQACLYNINPQYYRIHTSPVVVRSKQDPLTGYHYRILERFRPVYIKSEAIIFESNTTTA